MSLRNVTRWHHCPQVVGQCVMALVSGPVHWKPLWAFWIRIQNQFDSLQAGGQCFFILRSDCGFLQSFLTSDVSWNLTHASLSSAQVLGSRSSCRPFWWFALCLGRVRLCAGPCGAGGGTGSCRDSTTTAHWHLCAADALPLLRWWCVSLGKLLVLSWRFHLL